MLKRGKNHGLSGHPLYRVWANMTARCNYPSVDSHRWYGAMGIVVCKQWKRFLPFYNWAITNGWKKGLSLERINNSRNYCSSNCKFIDRKLQTRNQTSNVWLTAFGRRQIISDWSRETKIPYETLRLRIKRGWPHEKALTLRVGAEYGPNRSFERVFEWTSKR